MVFLMLILVRKIFISNRRIRRFAEFKALNFTENVFLFQHLRDNDFPSVEKLILDKAVVNNVYDDDLANQFYNGEDHTNNY
ncbi:Protein of unknown function [Cotesia congregata]|uniref:Uncharacterized protein n=1 Tax=Cotesia congregata TaxID=51543 RepID=A0A8J2HRT6_COTCN|nr:Protein of unknown function [Cotesia congregata]